MFRSVKPFRSCDLQISMKNDSVYADFHVRKVQGRPVLTLVRISFDGYGCCQVVGQACTMSADDSAVIQRMTAKSSLTRGDEEDAMHIMRCFFQKHQNHLWVDALTHHRLL